MQKLKSFAWQGAPVTIVDVDAILEAQWDSGGEVSPTSAWREVGIVNRSITLRMDSVASIPLALYQGDVEISRTGQDWEDPTGGLPDPALIYGLCEGAMAIYGNAYLSKDIDNTVTPGLRYLLPSSISFKCVAMNKGKQDVKFIRTVDKKQLPMWASTDIAYIWIKDPSVEFEPPKTSPVYAALSAIGVVDSFDEFTEKFSRSGMIKTTLLGVPRGTSKDERDRVENVFTRLFSGVKNAGKVKVIDAESIKPTVIGDGLESLEPGTITEVEKRIATQLGVPLSILFADAANYATATQDEKNFLSYTTVPDAQLITDNLNKQWYSERGYELRLLNQTMDAFQQDETERADAYGKYIESGWSHSLTAQVLGVELPPGWSYDDLEKFDKDQQSTQEPSEIPTEPSVEPEDDAEDRKAEEKAVAAKLQELTKWRRFALRRIKEGKPQKALRFQSEHLGPWLCHSIARELEAHPDKAALIFDLAKALVIGGDGEDENAPDPSRDERRLARQVSDILGEFEPQAREYVEGGDASPDYAALRDALFAALIAHYTKVATKRLEELEDELQLQVDDAESGAEISRWARRQADLRADQLTETTRQNIDTARGSYVEGMTEDEVTALLLVGFGPRRPDAIAITETTTSMSEGVSIYKLLIGALGVNSMRVWNTRRDERVCPVCGPLHGKKFEVWGADFPQGPPAHPWCRCYETLRIL